MICLSDSMEPAFAAGDMIFIRRVGDPAGLREGDVACYLLGSLAMFMQTTTGMIVFIICPLLLLVGWDVLRRSMDAKPRRHGQNINPNDIYEKETAMNKRGIIGRLAAVSLALCRLP